MRTHTKMLFVIAILTSSHAPAGEPEKFCDDGRLQTSEAPCEPSTEPESVSSLNSGQFCMSGESIENSENCPEHKSKVAATLSENKSNSSSANISSTEYCDSGEIKRTDQSC